MFGKKKVCLLGNGPVLPVADLTSTAEFYRDMLGFKIDFLMGDPPDHGSISRDRVGFQFTKTDDADHLRNYRGWTYVFVENVDLLFEEYKAKGLTITQPLTSYDYGMKEFEIQDLNGYRLRFGQYL